MLGLMLNIKCSNPIKYNIEDNNDKRKRHRESWTNNNYIGNENIPSFQQLVLYHFSICIEAEKPCQKLNMRY